MIIPKNVVGPVRPFDSAQDKLRFSSRVTRLVRHSLGNGGTNEVGYILILSMMIIAASITLVTIITTKSGVFVPYARLVVDREKASLLAFGGVQMALSQLALPSQKEDEHGTASAETTKKEEMQRNAPAEKERPNTQWVNQIRDGESAFLNRLLPVLNQWQIFTLSKEKDGVDGQVRICIVSEEGKIDINQIYDFKTKKFVGEGQDDQGKQRQESGGQEKKKEVGAQTPLHQGSGGQEKAADMKKVMSELFARVQQRMGGEELFVAFETFLKERKEPLIDVTELLHAKGFAVFKDALFYEPTDTTKKSGKQEQALFLTDIFTVSSGRKQLNPWLFSQSLRTLWGLETQDNKSILQETIKKFQQNTIGRPTEWRSDWGNILESLYKKKAKDLPALVPALLDPTFEANTFSVLSYGKIGKVTQKLLAIVAGERDSEGNFQQITIKKIYWL